MDLFGELTRQAFKQDWIEYLAGVSMGLSAIFILGVITYFRRWKWLWNEWLTALDPKKIGVMYLAVAFLMLVKGLIDATMMRAQQAFAVGDSFGYLGAEHFQQIFSAHGTTMIFFVAMPIVFALMNLIVPLQIGARDVAFPFVNAVSFWLFTAGGSYIMLSLVLGKFSGTGWVAYPPLSGVHYNPGVGVDYWIWCVQIAGVGSLLSGINFFVTIMKLRCPGLTFKKISLFVLCALCTTVLIMFAFPILTATLAMLTVDRYLGMHFFTAGHGGNLMMYVNLIWAWGHPEVYILILPIFGVFSEVVATFSGKRLFGHTSMVLAIVAITFLSFIVWLHHFFTMGAGANVNAFFAVMTMLIAIPTGVKIFNWLFTVYRGRMRFQTPMLWFLGFLLIFSIGGAAGITLSIAPVDFQFHNSLFLVAHFHSVIIGGVVFGFFAAFAYWFPKVTGFKLDEKLGRYAFWAWFSGFLLAFMPLYILGMMGATRRLNHYAAWTGWNPFFVIAAVGIAVIMVGLGLQVLQVVKSIRNRHQLRDTTGDPWNGHELEWATTSPPPVYNFAFIPQVHRRSPYWEVKRDEELSLYEEKEYTDIEVPKNTSIPLYIGISAFVFGFAMVWHIFWLAIVSFVAIITCVMVRMSKKETERTITAEEVRSIEERSQPA